MSAITTEAGRGAAPAPTDTRRRKTKYGGLTPWLFALPAIAIYLVFLV